MSYANIPEGLKAGIILINEESVNALARSDSDFYRTQGMVAVADGAAEEIGTLMGKADMLAAEVTSVYQRIIDKRNTARDRFARMQAERKGGDVPR